jgi:hypothetical protein
LFYGASLFFYRSLTDPIVCRAVLLFLWAYPAAWLVDEFFLQGFFVLNTYTFVLGGSALLGFSVAYLWQLYASDDTRSIFPDPVFWISIAFIFYCAISVPYIGMLNYLNTEFPAFSRDYYLHIYDATIIIYNLLLTTGLLCMSLYQKPS